MKLTSLPLEEDGFKSYPVEFCGTESYLIIPDITAKWNKQNLCYRSLIVRGSDFEVLSSGMKKFFNYSEKPDCYPDPEKHKDWVIQTKIDGCCDQNTIIYTENGPRTIKDICDTNYRGKVWGYDTESDISILTEILDTKITNNNNDWYLLELENGTQIKLTGNHRVWLPELNCYRKVEDLCGNEVFLLKR